MALYGAGFEALGYSARRACVDSLGKVALYRIPVIAGSPGKNAVLDIKYKSMAFENESAMHVCIKWYIYLHEEGSRVCVCVHICK